ncbi:MAG: type II secretion system F family protein [Candidatus Omnitrophota bacterium]
MLILIVLLLAVAAYLALYQFRPEVFGIEESHLPKDALYEGEGQKGMMKKFEGHIPIPFISGLKRKLVKAGFPIGVIEFLAFKILSLIIIPVAAFILLGKNFSPLPLFTISLAAGFLLPEIWLSGRIKKRQHRIRRDLPNAIDLLNLCVSGGLDFMLAVNTITRELKPCEVTRELSEVYRQTQMGKTRRQALKDLALRLDMPEIHSFVRMLIQADRMGTPLADALNLQAEEMRVRRFQQGEAMALKAPIKLLFPLFVFILPVVLIIVGGPILLQFMRGGANFGF